MAGSSFVTQILVRVYYGCFCHFFASQTKQVCYFFVDELFCGYPVINGYRQGREGVWFGQKGFYVYWRIVSSYCLEAGLSLVSKVAIFSYLIIVANILVFLQSISDPESYRLLIHNYGLFPVQVMNGTNLLSLVTSMFLHADILHLGLNMFFLLVSGDAVERELGNFRFLGLYLGFEVIAGLFHSYLNSTSVIPTI